MNKTYQGIQTVYSNTPPVKVVEQILNKIAADFIIEYDALQLATPDNMINVYKIEVTVEHQGKTW